MNLTFLLAALLTTFPAGLRAEQIFTNRGTLSGLKTQTEHNGELKEDSSTFFDQPPSLVMTQTFDPSYTGRYHSEVHIANGYRHGDRRFYGFAFRLAPDWQFDPPQSYNLAQFIAPFPDDDSRKCDAFMPSTMVWAEGRRLFTRLKSGSVCDQTTTELPLDGVAPLSAGEWHTVVLGASWTSEATNGSLQVWVDGKQVLDQRGVATTVAEDVPFQFRVGLYANGWHDDKGMKGSQGVRRVFYDKVAIATTKDEADPEKW
ncbi:polysaccharide lyase-domain-containing protein [Chaetomium strumarium]|uniref:Polysaccharide lyase-domain-containing protein n=1 Tax=Chaetomium strumarium TaxID=1170767 RepID=A0AAJ0GS91_9PEZI|nr:polysaccharide lyase-domain-containing protein [Chaetomium strumarium]